MRIYRLAIANTVEAKIIGLQEKKKALADGSLGEGTSKLRRLTVKELAGCEFTRYILRSIFFLITRFCYSVRLERRWRGYWIQLSPPPLMSFRSQLEVPRYIIVCIPATCFPLLD